MLAIVLQFIIGIGVGIYGYLTPGIINIQLFQLATSSKKVNILSVVAIISLVEIPYCIFCLSIFQWINSYAIIQTIIQWLIVVMLLSLGIMGLLKAYKKKNNPSEVATSGAVMSVKSLIWFAIINPFQWSAWSIWGAYFTEKNWFNWSVYGIGLFSIGAFIGTFIILYLYTYAGKKCLNLYAKYKFQIDIGIALLLITLGLVQVFKNIL